MGRGPRLLWLKIVTGVLALTLAAGVGVVVFKIVGLRDNITTTPLNLGTEGPGLPVDLQPGPGADPRPGHGHAGRHDGKYGSNGFVHRLRPLGRHDADGPVGGQ